LSLLAGSPTQINPADMFQMGDALGVLDELAAPLGLTWVFIHHARKANPAGHKNRASISFDDAAYSGLGQHARQWCFVNRRSDFDGASGLHEFELNFGGSLGHGIAGRLSVDEGTFDLHTLRSKWSVQFVEASGKTPKSSKVPKHAERVHKAIVEQNQRGVVPHQAKLTFALGLTKDAVRESVAYLEQAGRLQKAEVVIPGGFDAGRDGGKGFIAIVEGKEMLRSDAE
jgi:hypothetical protein